jgi:hypothetical protein
MRLETEKQLIELGLESESFNLNAQDTKLFLNAELIEVGINVQENTLSADFGTVTERDTAHDYYNGAYTVTPKTTAQTLETADKVMRADVDVKAIPTYEVSNDKGTTVYIGGDITWQ